MTILYVSRKTATQAVACEKKHLKKAIKKRTAVYLQTARARSAIETEITQFADSPSYVSDAVLTYSSDDDEWNRNIEAELAALRPRSRENAALAKLFAELDQLDQELKETDVRLRRLGERLRKLDAADKELMSSGIKK